MKLKTSLKNFINDNEYRILIKQGYVNIVNFSEIVDFTSCFIKVRRDDKITVIKGDNLVISKIFDNEILINGIIEEVIPFS